MENLLEKNLKTAIFEISLAKVAYRGDTNEFYFFVVKM